MQRQTPRLSLIAVKLPILEAALRGNAALAEHLQVEVDPAWTEFGRASLPYERDKLRADPGQVGWWTWLPVLRSENRLIGSGGYKGPPQHGTVEIGYEIAPAYRGHGLATELAAGLVEHAFDFPQVKRVQAHTPAEENASTRILTKLGFRCRGTMLETEQGGVWQWVRERG